MIDNNTINSKYFWYNEPKYAIRNKNLCISTTPDTDFWQKTHYGFVRDNGHCLFTKIDNDFSMVVHSEYQANNQYDQCGLILRIDAENWIKTSTEYETENHSRVGSVVTNLGFSDWATIDINQPAHNMWYRIQSKNSTCDYLIEYSEDGIVWKQLRITHLLIKHEEINVGVYACSPMSGSFDLIFDSFSLTKSNWK